jgi:hypothetical protein
VAAQQTLEWQTETVYVTRIRHTRDVQAALIAGSTFATVVAASPSNTKVDWQTAFPEQFHPPWAGALDVRSHQFQQAQPPLPPGPTRGWEGISVAVVYSPIVLTAFQPYPVGPPSITISVTKQGWWGYQHDYRYSKPFPVAEQIFSVVPYPAPAFAPPGGGKKRLYPSWTPQPPDNVRPNKTYRPVWDKPAPQIAPAAPKPVPRPPSTLFGPAPVQPLPADKLALPDFSQYGAPDARALDQHMREVQDMNDALAVLRSLGLIQDDNGEQ